MVKRRIGFFTYRLPYPLVSGGQIRAYYLLKALAKEFDVTLFSFYKDPVELAAKKELAFCKNIYTFKRRELKNAHNLYKLLISNFNTVRPMLSGLPFAASLYYLPAVKAEFEQLVKKEGLEAVQFESFYPAVYMTRDLPVTKIFGTENLEYQVYERYVNSLNVVTKSFLRIEIARMKGFEESLYKRADFNLAVSKSEKDEINRITGQDAYLIPNGVDIDRFNKKKTKNKMPVVLYIGSFKYFQNQQAIRTIVQEIAPKIGGRAKFLIISRGLPPALKRSYALPNVEIDTSMGDPVQAFTRSDITLVPVSSAGGTRIKILEAFASKVAVITSKVGIAGIEATSGKDYLEADTALDFITKLTNLLDDPRQIDILTNSAFNLAREKYNWKTIAEELVALYKNQFLNRP